MNPHASQISFRFPAVFLAFWQIVCSHVPRWSAPLLTKKLYPQLPPAVRARSHLATMTDFWHCNHVVRDGLHCHQCSCSHMTTEKKHIVVAKCERALIHPPLKPYLQESQLWGNFIYEAHLGRASGGFLVVTWLEMLFRCDGSSTCIMFFQWCLPSRITKVPHWLGSTKKGNDDILQSTTTSKNSWLSNWRGT